MTPTIQRLLDVETTVAIVATIVAIAVEAKDGDKEGRLSDETLQNLIKRVVMVSFACYGYFGQFLRIYSSL